MHPFMGLNIERDYLKGYWNKMPLADSQKQCVWSIDARLVKNNKRHWENIRNLRNHKEVKKGFIQQEEITVDEHESHMSLHGDCYYICLIENEFAGYVGAIDNDIRVATNPPFQGKGVGKFMINTLINLHPDAFAKVKIDNEASVKLFESCGFKKKYYILEKE